MSNIKSWADASSDEDSDCERQSTPASESFTPSSLQPGPEALDSATKDFHELALEPPYTAYIGNVHPDLIRNSEQFQAELEAIVADRQCLVQIQSVRLVVEKYTGISRGYGYVEFSAREDLLTFLKLKNLQLGGRSLKVDVASAEAPRGNSVSGRGRGRGERRRNSYARSDSARLERQYSDGPRAESGGSGGNNNSHRNSVRERGEGPVDGSQFRGGRFMRSNSSMSAKTGSPPRQRPSLQILPRSIPLENSSSGRDGPSSSSIFGGATPRDETKFMAWKSKKEGEGEAVINGEKGSISENVKEVMEITNEKRGKEGVKELHAANAEGVAFENHTVTETHNGTKSERNDKGTKEMNGDKASPLEEKIINKSTKVPGPKKNFERRASKKGLNAGGKSIGNGGESSDQIKDKDEQSKTDDIKKDGWKESGLSRKSSGRSSGRGGGRGYHNRSNSDRKNGAKNNAPRDSVMRGDSLIEVNTTTSKDGKVPNGEDAPAVTTGRQSVITQPQVKTKNKAVPTKKTNSFAAFIDDSDDE